MKTTICEHLLKRFFSFPAYFIVVLSAAQFLELNLLSKQYLTISYSVCVCGLHSKAGANIDFISS